MDKEKVIKDNAVRGLQSAIEISGAMVHLRKEHAKALLALLKKQETPILTINDAVSELMDRHYDRLKEQETVVHPESSCEMTYITDCCCDLCGVQLIREDNFCRGCGKPIDWSK